MDTRLNVVGFVVGGNPACLPAVVVTDLTGIENAPEGRQPLHVSEVLGFARAQRPDDERLLTLMVDNEVHYALVDGPVTFTALEPEQMLKLPAGLHAGIAGPVVGITERDGTLGYVLDPKLLVETLLVHRSPTG